MYGEQYGTGTLAKMLTCMSADMYKDIDNGVQYKEMLETARDLMEGSIVLYTSLLEEAYGND